MTRYVVPGIVRTIQQSIVILSWQLPLRVSLCGIVWASRLTLVYQICYTGISALRWRTNPAPARSIRCHE